MSLDNLRRKAEILSSESAKLKGKKGGLSPLEIDTMVAQVAFL